MTSPLNRSEAVQLGEIKYFTGKPCSNNHIDFRYTSNKTCVSCSRERMNSYFHKYKNDLAFRLKKGKSRCGYDCSVEKYKELHEAQEGCCAICKTPEEELTRGFHIDHCHTTGAVRGLLCGRCNTAIGSLRDSPEICLQAASYLKGSKQHNNSYCSYNVQIVYYKYYVKEQASYYV